MLAAHGRRGRAGHPHRGEEQEQTFLKRQPAFFAMWVATHIASLPSAVLFPPQAAFLGCCANERVLLSSHPGVLPTEC